MCCYLYAPIIVSLARQFREGQHSGRTDILDGCLARLGQSHSAALATTTFGDNFIQGPML